LAAQRAAGVYAHGEAARLLEQALQVQDVLDPKDDEKRYELMNTLADALLSTGEPARVSHEIAPEMFAIAERLGDSDRAASASGLATEALGRRDAGPAFKSAEWVMWTERMYRHTAPDTYLRARADAIAGLTHMAFGRMREYWEQKIAALDQARRLGDPEMLALARGTFVSPGAPPELEHERANAAEELVAMSGTGTGLRLRPAVVALRLRGLAGAFLSVGERHKANSAQQELDDYARRIGDPFVQTQAATREAQWLALSGELQASVEAIERFAGSAAGVEPIGQASAANAASPVLTRLGRFEEALTKRAFWGTFAGYEGMAAYIPAASGLTDEARSETRRLIAERAIRAEDDWTDTPTLVYLLAASIITQDMDVLRMLHQRLSGFDDLYAPEAYSTVARQLGLADLLLDDPAAARAQFASALDVAAKVGDRPETALVRLAIARTLFEHYPDERAEAVEHLNFALGEFQTMKMRPALEEAMRLRMRDQGISTITADIYTSIVAVAESVERERPDIASHAAPDGTVTIMFSDIEDSTVLTERLGDQAWQDLLRKHNALIRAQLQAHEGYEVKTMGDGFMVAFQSAKKGLDCAIAIQRAFANHNAAEGEHVKVRIGLHAGETIKDGDDFYGKNVILASRVAGKAVGGEILVSSLLRQLVESSVGAGTFGEPREMELKGLSGTHVVYAVASM
jgi:class 3 adenylate cyclase